MSLSISGGQAVGHPVDVASGNLFHEFADHTIPGRMLLSFQRRYSGRLVGVERGMFGSGWSSPFEMDLREDVDGYRMRATHGEAEISFDGSRTDLANGRSVLSIGSFHELYLRSGTLAVCHWNPFHEAVVHYEFGRELSGRWLLTAIRGADGRTIRITHDEAGRVLGIEQAREQRAYALEYTAGGRVSRVYRTSSPRVTDGSIRLIPPRLVISYEYDELGRLSGMLDALGNRGSYRYDVAGRLIRETTVSGMEFYFSYDRLGRCIETKGPDGFDLNRLEIDAIARVTKVTNAAGAVTTFRWNESGQIVEKHSPMGNVSATEYDEYGRIVAQIQPNGASTRHRYDARGDRVAVTNALQAETLYRFDARHQVVCVKDPIGREWSREIDDEGRIVQLALPNGERWRYSFDAAGDLVAISSPIGAARRFERNGRGEVVRMMDWNGHSTRYEYDDEGRISAVLDALAERTEYSYDALGHLARIRHPDGSSRRFDRNVYNQVTCYTDQLGRETRLRYGGCGALLEIVRPSGSRTELEWTKVAGRLAGVTDGLGRRQQFEYDLDGRSTCVTDFSGRTTRYAFDANGQVSEVLDSRGSVTKYVRDLLGLVRAVEFDDGSRTEYGYDSCGNLIHADNGDVLVDFELDLLGRVVRERQGEVTITSEFDALGRRSRRISSLGHDTHFAWDDNGSIARVQTVGSEGIFFAHDARRDEVARWLEGGAGIHRSWDARRRPREQAVGKHLGLRGGRMLEGDAATSKRGFEFDAASNLLAVHGSEGTSRFAYDVDSRIIEATHAGPRWERFTHDAADNITAVRRESSDAPDHGPGEPWIHGPGNELLARAGDRYEYDELGQRTAKWSADGCTRYEWSRRGELRRVLLPDGSEWRYRYDSFGRRVEKSGPSGVCRFVWDGDVVLHEIARTGNGKERVVHWEFDPRSFDPVSRTEDGRTLLCVVDATHLPRELVDASGVLVWRAEFDTFGAARKKVTRGGIECPIRFPGQWFDEETGLHYNRFRYFDPVEGSYISRDPLGLAGGLNGYAYPRNPFGWIDPYGLTKLCGHIPDGATILDDKSPNYLIYEKDGQKFIIFKADQAVTGGAANPGRNYTTDTLAGLNENGQPYVHEGRHRAIGVATSGDRVSADNGGVPALPGYLRYEYTDNPASGGQPVKGMKIDYSQPDLGKSDADKAWDDRHG